MSTKEYHMITVLNEQLSGKRIAAFRVIDTAVRKFTFTASTRNPAVGEAIHVEAKGVIAIEGVPVKMDLEGVCSRSTHRHVRNDSANPDLEGEAGNWITNMSADAELCVIPEYYPASLHFDVPVGDLLPPALGDNLIVTIRRADGPDEHQYVTDEPARRSWVTFAGNCNIGSPGGEVVA